MYKLFYLFVTHEKTYNYTIPITIKLRSICTMATVSCVSHDPS